MDDVVQEGMKDKAIDQTSETRNDLLAKLVAANMEESGIGESGARLSPSELQG